MNVEARELARPVRVALLEDHRTLREALQAALEPEGIEFCISCHEAGSFLAAVGTSGAEVAVVDLILSAGVAREGVDVVRALQRAEPALPVVVLTADGSAEAMELCRQAGVSRFLPKLTTGPAELASVLRLAAGRGAPDDPAGRSPPVTGRERDVLRHLARGADNLTIAAHLAITERTVKAHVSSLYRKLRCDNRAELALLAHRLGYGKPDRG